VSIADFSELLLSKLKEGEEALYYRRIPDPTRIGLLIGAAFLLAVALNTFLMGYHYEIDLALQGSLILGFGLLTLLGGWLVGYREILVTRERMLITKIAGSSKIFYEIPLSSIEEVTLHSKSNLLTLLIVILLTGPLLIPLCILYWKSRRIIVRGDVEHSIPVRGRAAAVIVRDVNKVLGGEAQGR
jgi:hypothetical protein